MSEFDHILDNPFTAEAKVIADSVSPEGVRLTSVQEKFWTPILAERNTHKSQYGNCASQRAIPVEKILRKFIEEPAYPVTWPSEQPGMQGGATLEGEHLDDALGLWDGIHKYVANSIQDYLDQHPDKSTRLHKGHLNRLMTFGQWSTRITTATSWENFFDQRCAPDAQPEIQAVAHKIRQAMDDSIPSLLSEGEWHLPYIGDDEEALDQLAGAVDHPAPWLPAAKASAARCARTSYETQEGHRDVEEDLRLYDRLVTDRLTAGLSIHWSPLEHVATPCRANRQDEWSGLTIGDGTFGRGRGTWVPVNHLPKVGSLVGWMNLRTRVEAENSVVTFR